MYILLIIIWFIAVYIGLSFFLKTIFNIKLYKRVFNIKLFRPLFLRARIFKIEVSAQLKTLMTNPLVHLFFYTIFLLIITILSQLILPEDPPPKWVAIIIILLGVAAIIIIPMILINFLVYSFIKSVETIPSDIKSLKQEKKLLTGFIMFMKVLFIMISPSIIFSFIYGLGTFISNFPELLRDLISLKLFIYSMSVSFPIPIEEIIDQETSWWKYISFLQVVLQRIIEIGVLGYIINIFYETFKYNDASKNDNA